MGALTSDRVKADLQGSVGAVQGFLIAGHQGQNALGGSGDRTIVDVLGSVELVSDMLEVSGVFRPAADSFRETLAIAEQQGFEFVHHDERHEPSGVESVAHVPDHIIMEGMFDAGRSARK